MALPVAVVRPNGRRYFGFSTEGDLVDRGGLVSKEEEDAALDRARNCSGKLRALDDAGVVAGEIERRRIACTGQAQPAKGVTAVAGLKFNREHGAAGEG